MNDWHLSCSRIGGPAAVAVILLLLGSGCQRFPPSCEGTCNDEGPEPNGTFSRAKTVALALDNSALLAGAIAPGGDVDVYDLGAVQAGDVVHVEVSRRTGRLRAALALYDSEGELIDEDTLTSITSFGDNPAIDHAVRADTDQLFVAISQSIVGASAGDYEVTVSIDRGGVPPTPVAQVVLLNYEGGTFIDPLFGPIDAEPFDAADIDVIYAGDTVLVKDAIKQAFLQNYERFDLVVLDTDIDVVPDGVDVSEIIFGGFNGFAFGAADDVDLYNRNRADMAIVFTESFEPDLFPRAPSISELGEAIGNVAAHEFGHLLGLHHVNDSTALMDEASPAVTLLADQEFKRAPLSTAVFPLGSQDAADLLRVILGANPLLAKMRRGPALTRTFEESVAEVGIGPPGSAPAGAFGKINAASRQLPGKCLTCMRREARAGKGPLRHLTGARADGD